MYGYGYGYEYPSYAYAGVFGLAFGMTIFIVIIGIIALILTFIGLWKTFEKMGLPGWEALIMGHNLVLLFEKADLPKQHVFFYYIPWIGWIGANIYMGINLMKKFGKSTGMGVLVGLIPPIGFMITGFSKDYVYQGTRPEVKVETQSTNGTNNN